MRPIRIALLTAFAALTLAAQTPAADAITSLEQALKSVAPVTTPVPVATTERPTAWIGAGAVYNPNSKKTTGWATYARLIDAKSGTYFFTTEDAMPVKSPSGKLLDTTIQTSVRVGIGTILKEVGRFKLIGLCDGGGATIGSASSGAASCGSLLAFRASTHWTVIAGFRVIKTALVSGTPKQYEIGVGRDWGK